MSSQSHLPYCRVMPAGASAINAENPYAGVIKIGRGDYVVDPYTCAKVRHNPPRGFVSAHA